jgi:site-specific recombinase XerD
MGQSLDAIARVLTNGACNATSIPWHLLRYQHTQAVRAWLAGSYSPATANRMLAAVRGVLKEAWRLGLMVAADYHRTSDLPAVKGTRLPPGRALNAGELRALFNACTAGRPPIGARDAALLTLLYGAGLRRSEAVAVDTADYDPDTGAITVRHGKGNKQRVVYLGHTGRAAVDFWITARAMGTDALLNPVTKGGLVVPRRMTGQAVLKRLRHLAGKSGVAHFSPHDCRRSFISHLLDAGADIATVQRLAGHASTTTTSRYDRRGERAKQKASGLLHVPFTPQPGGQS